MTQHPQLALVARRIEHEYNELPGLRLTRWQAARLWALEQDECETVLRALVNNRVLRETPGGFVRR